MNFGAGGMGGYGGSFPPSGAPFGQGMDPFYANNHAPGMFAGMPAVGGMQAPGMMQGQHDPAALGGSGPLGDAPARLGANGLYEAPELEGPEEHGMFEQDDPLSYFFFSPIVAQ